MKSLTYARQRALQCREALDAPTHGLLARLEAYLATTHSIELHAVNDAFLEGGRAEVSPAEGCLFYTEALDDDAPAKLVVVLHELGHLELHARLQRCCVAPDPVFGSMYLNDGAPALARYNRRAREEAEANAFAMEFLCPSRTVLQRWQSRADQTTDDIAQSLGVPVAVVQAQLAEALYWVALPGDAVRPEVGSSAVAYNDSQLEAATCTGSPVLVHAGPGTGKTATLVRRIAYLFEAIQAEPEHILVLTFSNHAAEELRERIAVQFGAQQAARLEVSTFHGFGVTFLHHHGQYVQLNDDAVILDEAGQLELVTRLIGTVPCASLLNLHNPEATVQSIVRHIGYLKDRLCSPQALASTLAAWRPTAQEGEQYEAAHELLGLYHAYEAAKREQQRVDFADLIALPVSILDQVPALRRAYQDKYTWVMVDEYQDVSRAVAGLLQRLCGERNPPWVVGDTRQAIYRFRGAAPENVDRFDHDFPAAKIFHLGTNYRSCDEIVQAANQLASIMTTTAHEVPHSVAHWATGSDIGKLGEVAVAIARADSDQAEYEGIAAQIESWLDSGVTASDIAVLARRNIDVKSIVLALGKRGIRAATSGLVTPEGAAGDLAAVTTLVDQPRASIPRLAFALGRDRFPPAVINAVIERILATLDDEDHFAVDGHDGSGNALAAALRRVCEHADSERFSSDAFAMMCTFLFDSSPYLHRLLERPAGAEQALALREIVTSLARAAGYRFLHPEADPQLSRKGFAQYFRATLSTSAPSSIPPPGSDSVVRVMTCHAAKGLEFPCVIAAGQTLSPSATSYPWLPPQLTPAAQDDIEQADALFFVAATRAQRALVVTYATSASGAARSRARTATPLLNRWLTLHDVATRVLPTQPQERRQIVMDALWGGAPRGALPASSLAPTGCPIRTYLEHYCGVRYPLNMRPLYPIFFDALRRAMGRIVRQAHAQGRRVEHAQATDIFWQIWSRREVADHPHHDLYVDLANEYIEHFARVYEPHPAARVHHDLTVVETSTGLALRHDLLAHYETQDGTTIAIAWRPESLAEKARDNGLLWSGLSPAHRVSLVILKQSAPALQPYVYSAADGTLYPYAWTSNAAAGQREAARLAQQLEAIKQQRFATTINPWQCDRCPVRVSCPVWLGAVNDGEQ